MIPSLILIGKLMFANVELRTGFVCFLACTSVALGRGEQQALHGRGICKSLTLHAPVLGCLRLEFSSQQFVPLSFARLKEE